MSAIESQNQRSKYRPGEDYNAKGSLKKIATSGYNMGRWLNSSKKRRTSAKQEYYRYPNPAGGATSKNVHKRLYSGHPNGRMKNNFRLSDRDEPPVSTLSVNNSMFKEDYGQLEQQIQGAVNQPLL